MEDLKQWMASYPEGYTHDFDIPDLSLFDMLKETAQRFPDRPATKFYRHTLTYQQLYHSVLAFAGALQRKGIQKGERVAIMLPNCPHYVIAYFGIVAAGGIVAQVNPMLVERELEYILRDSGAKKMVLLDSFYPKLQAVRSRTHIDFTVTVSLQKSFIPSSPDKAFQEFVTPQHNFQPAEIDPKHDIAVLQYTGGTTGPAKGAMLTHTNVLVNAIQSYEIFKNDIEPGKEKCLTVVPLFHVFGMTACMNLSILCGNELLLLPRFDLEEVLETIKREQPTIFPGVPTMYVAITNHPRAEEYDIDCIRICNSGSAPMPVELMKEFERKAGAKVLEGYGLSEASPVTHCNPPFAARKPGTVGLGLPKTACKIVDIATGTQEMPAGELGEVIIKGPQVMKGYWNQPEETANILRNGWLYTGDIGRMDREGYLSIVDRKKDMIIAGGFNVYPRDIEEVLYEHPAVQEAVVIGVPDEYLGESIKAVLVLKAGKMASEEEIISYCRGHLAAYKIPRIVEFRQELPKTGIGKILRRALTEEWTKKQV
ncbi:MAG TPA: long-chain fatty acid--CoA ligase [Bacillus sp. (in: firmicutes)]|nr:long-chain fatty acid--CoA ligase [Bacillus sp. (in: firmicutes)]